MSTPPLLSTKSGSGGPCSNIGILLGDTGKTAAAMEEYESALAIRQKLADAV